MDKTITAYVLSIVGFVLFPKSIVILLYFLGNHRDTANWVILVGILATNMVYILALDLISHTSKKYILYTLLMAPLVLDMVACLAFKYEYPDFILWPSITVCVVILHLISMGCNLYYRQDKAIDIV
jgi:hypothetical protein